MPKLKDQQDADRQYDPYSNQNARELLRQDDAAGSAYASAGADQAEAFANDPKNATSNNIDQTKNLEETPNEFNFTPSDDESSGPRTFSFKGVLKNKRAASGGLIGLILTLVGMLSFFISPGLAVVQMKEILTDDLNDQLGAMDRRTAYVMRAKLNDMGKGVCTGIKIRCGFKGMSDRQISKFKAAGFEVETKGKVLGRNHVVSLSITDSGGNKIVVKDPRELYKAGGNRTVQTALRKAFNPKFAGFFDAKWDAFKQRFKLTSQDKLGTGSEEEKRTNVTSAVEGEPISIDGAERVATTDEDGNPIDGADKDNEAIDRANEGISKESVPTKSILGSAGSGAVKGIGILGAADAACTVKNTARAVEAGAKIYRYRQLISYAMVFLTFADSVKAGTATPDQAEFVGNTLTAVDTDKTIYSENSGKDGDGNPQKVDNPYYGANAFDSAGYKTALYNEAPTLSARDMQMAVGGGMALGMLSKVNKFIDKYGGGNCKLIQNWAVRGGSIVVGVFAGVITFGGATLASIGASVAISMALPILQNYLSQMMAGTVANGDTNGVDAGNAIFAGTAALMGGMAMSRGMKPATKSDLKSYLALNDEVKDEYVAMETEEAKKTPLDINNRYSFVGSIARSILPVKTTSSLTMGSSMLSGITSILGAPLLSSKVQAASAYNEDRFEKCTDNGYNELGIDADIFCNVRYVLTPYELGLGTEEVRVQMMEWGMVNDDEEGSVVVDSDYDKWLTECTEREQGWGETEEENQEDGDGTRCMGTSKRDSYYRVYTMDASIIAAMDYIPPTGSGDGTTGGSEFRISSYNILGKSHTAGDSWKGRADKVISNVTGNAIDIIGFQEFEDAQRDYIAKALPSYGITTHGKLGDGIMWNTEKYELVNKGTWQTTYFAGAIQEPWIKLQDVTTKQEFFVMNVHDPINRDAGDAETRTANAKKHLETIKKLQTEAPVVLTGDFNNGYDKDDGAGVSTNEDTAYCILSSSGLMVHAYDAMTDRKFKCPNPLPGSAGISTTIDHIYISNGMDATKFFDVDRETSGSDHPALIADVVIPAVGSGTGAGTDFVMGSYNQPIRGNSTVAYQKIKESQMDIVGMQELGGPNYFNIKSNLAKAGYNVYPNIKQGENKSAHCSNARPIFYNESGTTGTKFKLVKSEIFDVPSYETTKTSQAAPDYVEPRACGNNGEMTKGGGRANVPIVWLEDKETGQMIIVMNTHNLANCCGSAGVASKKRLQAADIYTEKVKALKQSNPDVPIFFSGDFNEGTGVRRDGNRTFDLDHNNLLYCKFKQSGDMFRAIGSNDQPCKSDTEGIGGVDYVYATQGVKVDWTKEFLDPSTNDSPHKVIYGKLTVPGAKSATPGAPGSDVVGNDYAGECVALIGARACTEECVAFVKFRLVKHGVLKTAISLGNGKEVTSTLGRLGFEVNRTPAVHSVFSTSATSTPQWGHTGMVSAVNPDGSIVVEEYNFAVDHGYGKRTLTKKQYTDAGYTFAHTETKYR